MCVFAFVFFYLNSAWTDNSHIYACLGWWAKFSPKQNCTFRHMEDFSTIQAACCLMLLLTVNFQTRLSLTTWTFQTFWKEELWTFLRQPNILNRNKFFSHLELSEQGQAGVFRSIDSIKIFILCIYYYRLGRTTITTNKTSPGVLWRSTRQQITRQLVQSQTRTRKFLSSTPPWA